MKISVNINASYIYQIPGPNTTIFISANNRCLCVSEACSAAIRRVIVASKVVKKFTSGRIKQSDMGIKCGYEKRSGISRGGNRGDGLCET